MNVWNECLKWIFEVNVWNKRLEWTFEDSEMESPKWKYEMKVRVRYEISEGSEQEYDSKLVKGNCSKEGRIREKWNGWFFANLEHLSKFERLLGSTIWTSNGRL